MSWKLLLKNRSREIVEMLHHAVRLKSLLPVVTPAGPGQHQVSFAAYALAHFHIQLLVPDTE